MKQSIFITVILLIMATGLMAEDWLTIYNDDLSLVRSRFELTLKKGKQDFSFDDITSSISPASVIVSSREAGFSVAEQNYEYDMAGKWQIMAKYLNKEVELVTKNGNTVIGILKFFDGSSYGVTESGTDRLIMVSDAETQLIQLSKMPENFYVKPTLRWSLISPKAGKIPIQLTYLSSGFGWEVTYNSVWDDKTLKLNSWVTIDNTSGKAFNDVNLKLIAGEVNRVYDYYDKDYSSRNYYEEMVMDTGMGGMAPSFEEKAFHDFHIYTLDQKVSFANNQSKQIALYPPQNVKAEGVYEYNTWGDGIKSIIRFKNTEENGIGKPLPKGTIKVYKEDTDGNLEFIGEDRIDHKGRNEEISINTGKAFDLVGSTMSKDSKSLGPKASERTIQVTLMNNADEVKTIDVVHQMGGNTKITQQDYDFELDTNNKATFRIVIQPDTQIVFTFRERTEY